jgi:hypothetical protein
MYRFAPSGVDGRVLLEYAKTPAGRAICEEGHGQYEFRELGRKNEVTKVVSTVVIDSSIVTRNMFRSLQLAMQMQSSAAFFRVAA